MAILIIAWLALFAGINTIPVEEHEAFVLQTAREMNHTGDWVLPYFNQEPRLKKPPLNYWLTLGVARLSGSDFEPWTGRLCSMLAGLAVVLLTACVGGKLYGVRAGFLAAMLLLGTRGFCDFSNHARPDFLYAVLCVLQLYTWIGSWRAADGTLLQRGMAAMGWVMVGLATLAKGPQMPALFLLGFLLFLLCGDERRRTLKILRPFSGLVILMAVTLPWWLLLQQRLRMADIDLRQTQLSGSLLQTLSGWKEIFSFYYAIELLRLLLPVSLLIPLLVFRNRRKREIPTGVDRLLLYVGAVTLAVFTVAGHYRLHYMLPLMPPCILLLAGWISRTAGRSVNGVIWSGLIGVGGIALAACAGLVIWQHQYATILWLTGTGVALFYLLQMEMRTPMWVEHPLSAQLAVVSLLTVLLMAGFNALPLRHKVQEQDRDFALSIAREVNPGDYLAAWRRFPDILPYYVSNRVIFLNDLENLKASFEQKREGQDVYLVVPATGMPAVKGVFEVETLTVMESRQKPGRTLIFLKILSALP
jgi:4-amino-4-deoxy-L-arabinose transferase-like glycosyltransferase